MVPARKHHHLVHIQPTNGQERGNFCLLASNDDSHEEQHAGQIAEKGNEPGLEKIEDGDPSMEECHGHEHDVAGEEVGSGENHHDEADGEDDGSDHSDETYIG